MTDKNLRQGIWRLADPKISITSAASMAIGASLAADNAQFSLLWLLIFGATLFCFEVAKNAWGEVYDYDSGTDLAVAPADRTDFSGGKRVLVDALLTRRQTWCCAIGFGGAGLLISALLVLQREATVLWLGITGLVLLWSYHGPPLQLAYRGLGELAVLICYGPLIALATYVVMTGHHAWLPVALALPLGMLISAFLWVNEFPDHDADRSSGKRNLVVKLGKQRAARMLALIYAIAFGTLTAMPLITDAPVTCLLGLAAVPGAVAVTRWTLQDPNTFYRHKPAQSLALVTFVLYSAGVSIGVLMH